MIACFARPSAIVLIAVKRYQPRIPQFYQSSAKLTVRCVGSKEKT